MFCKYESSKIKMVEISKIFEEDCKVAVPSVPLYIKVLFPFLSPFYYLLGFPIIKIFSGKIINDIIFKGINEIFYDFAYEYFYFMIVLGLNDGIEGLNKISKKFKNLYFSKKLENKLYQILFEEKNSIIDQNNFNAFLDDLLKTNTEKEILNFVNNYFKENEEFLLSDVDKNKKDMILKLIENKI